MSWHKYLVQCWWPLVVGLAATTAASANADPASIEGNGTVDLDPSARAKVKRLKIAGWTLVGVGALTPIVTFSAVRPSGPDVDGDAITDVDNTDVQVARGVSVAAALALGGAAAGMLVRARHIRLGRTPKPVGRDQPSTRGLTLRLAPGIATLSGRF